MDFLAPFMRWGLNQVLRGLIPFDMSLYASRPPHETFSGERLTDELRISRSMFSVPVSATNPGSLFVIALNAHFKAVLSGLPFQGTPRSFSGVEDLLGDFVEMVSWRS